MITSTRGKFSRSRSSRPLPPSDSPIQRSARSMPTCHAALGGAAAGGLLSHPGGVQFHVRTSLPVIILVPGPVHLRAEDRAGGDGVGQTLTGVLGGPLHGRLGEPHAGHLVEQVGAPLEAVGDRPGQRGDPLQGRGQIAGRHAGVAVEGEQAFAPDPAEVVGATVVDGPHQAEGGMHAVRMELGGAPAVRARYRGTFVAVFFPARCRSIALAAILWAIARIWNSFGPKRWASSVEARLSASSWISASTASRMACARSWISASFSGSTGADDMGRLRFRRQVSLRSPHFRSCVQRFHLLSRRPPTTRTGWRLY